MTENQSKTEIIAIASGKGGTGKTLITACLGYSLIRAGHKVLLIDGDPGTDGLSLFLLGPKGMKQIKYVDPENTFTGILNSIANNEAPNLRPFEIRRDIKDDKAKDMMDHGVTYHSYISATGIYGDFSQNNEKVNSLNQHAVPPLDRDTFRRAIAELFDRVRDANIENDENDEGFRYVLIDTRGGFSFESTDVCALADSFIVVTEPDYTSFYQDRNLVWRINQAASELGKKPLLRAVIVNKAVEGEEKAFRLALEEEFPLKFDETYPIPLEIEAIMAYKTQRIPYVAVPASRFVSATLSAFADIMQVVTAQWRDDHVAGWNALVSEISDAQKKRQAEADATEKSRTSLRQSIRLHPIAITLLFVAILMMAVGFYAVGNKRVSNVLHLASEQAKLADKLVIAYDNNARATDRIDSLKSLILSGRKSFPSIRLSGVDLSGLNLEGVNLRGATLVEANLSATILRSVDLRDANLTNANLQRADLTMAELSGANLQGAIMTDAIGDLDRYKLRPQK